MGLFEGFLSIFDQKQKKRLILLHFRQADLHLGGQQVPEAAGRAHGQIEVDRHQFHPVHQAQCENGAPFV